MLIHQISLCFSNIDLMNSCIDSKLLCKTNSGSKNHITAVSLLSNSTLHRFSLRHTQVRTYNSTMNGREKVYFLSFFPVMHPAASFSGRHVQRSVERSQGSTVILGCHRGTKEVVLYRVRCRVAQLGLSESRMRWVGWTTISPFLWRDAHLRNVKSSLVWMLLEL